MLSSSSGRRSFLFFGSVVTMFIVSAFADISNVAAGPQSAGSNSAPNSSIKSTKLGNYSPTFVRPQLQRAAHRVVRCSQVRFTRLPRRILLPATRQQL